jgi:hypothetical protein
MTIDVLAKAQGIESRKHPTMLAGGDQNQTGTSVWVYLGLSYTIPDSHRHDMNLRHFPILSKGVLHLHSHPTPPWQRLYIPEVERTCWNMLKEHVVYIPEIEITWNNKKKLIEDYYLRYTLLLLLLLFNIIITPRLD